MTYRFSGTPEDLITACLEHLRRAGTDDSDDAQAYLRLALAELVGLHHLGAAAGGIDGDRLRGFRQASLPLLLGLADRVGFTLNEALLLAEAANDDEWYELCMNRSAIQCLLDDYPDTPLPGLFDRGELADLDEALRRVGAQQGPVAEDLVPRGLPDSHWWWHYPAAARPVQPPATRVLAAELTYATLRQRLEEAGWDCVTASHQPLIPGEPEFAVFERGAGERLAYSFNPVCRLRLLEGPVPRAAAGGELLPAVGPEQVLDWLRDPEERTLLRGLLAARHLPSPTLLGQVERLRGHPSQTLAKAATQTAETLRGTLRQAEGPAEARRQALAAVEVLRALLAPLLQALCHERSGEVLRAVQPRQEDYAKAFVPEVAEAARQAYREVWREPFDMRYPGADQTQLLCHLAPAGMLAEENELSQHFPGGYRAIAHLLDPHRVWARWKCVRPGEDAGMAYDGLVWLDDHWAWFPKPYRTLAHLLD